MKLWTKLVRVFRPHVEVSADAPEPRAPEDEVPDASFPGASASAPAEEAKPPAAVLGEGDPVVLVLDPVRRPGPPGSAFQHAVALTPSDSVWLDATRGLWIGGGGTVVVDLLGGAQGVVFAAVPSGVLLPVRATRLRSGTSAGGVVAVY